MIRFRDEVYQLFFSNNLEPLRALNYADELFFKEFEALCGSRYRILSIIRNGWQEKYGLQSDITNLKKTFEAKLSESGWSERILNAYEAKRDAFAGTLTRLKSTSYANATAEVLSSDLATVREQAAPLDAASNMLHLFSSLVGDGFIGRLRSYSSDADAVNANFIFYSQPVKEGKFAKIQMSDLEGKFELSAEDKALSDMLRTGAYIKDDVSALLEERGEAMAGLFEEIGRRVSVTSSDLYYLTIPEVKEMLQNGKASAELIIARKQVTILFYAVRELKIYEGTKAEDLLTAGHYGDVAVETTDISLLKGQTAALGIARGRAVVVRNSEEAMRLVETGDILVAPYTAPEYLPAMKKAIAILTETGGITSHAAIVSRELKIPCVIGVPDITKILVTGDEIEVDAGKGEIRILKKASR